MASQVSRAVIKKVFAVETPEGAGARVRRSIGSMALRNYTPFLMLDHFKIGRGAGFPDHPHRGQATFTYIIKGNTKHEDSQGHKGLLTEGGIQLMTAGRGVIHAEMPFWPTPDAPDPEGMQLWIDIPKDKKMMAPDYQEYSGDQLPIVKPHPNTSIKILSGKSYGAESPVKPFGGCWYLHVYADAATPEETIFQEIPAGWTTFIYIMKGSIKVGEDQTVYPEFHTLILTSEETQDGVKITHLTPEMSYIVVAGLPLDQEVVQYGPFVMTSKAEIQQTLADYRNGRNGFENAHTWQSEIGNQ